MTDRIQIERVQEVTDEIAAGIGAVLPDLSDNFDGSPVDIDLLREIVDSKTADHIIARVEGRIVGSAVMNLITSHERKAWLEDFVVLDEPELRGTGIGTSLWNECRAWALEMGASRIDFTSSPKRELAQGFYLSKGAERRETTAFRYELDS